MNALLQRGLCAAWAMGLLAASPAAQARSIAYGLAIGNNAPPAGATDDSTPELEYADDDAVRYHQLFLRLAKRSTLLTVFDAATHRRHSALAPSSRPPTLRNLRAEVLALSREMEEDRARGDEPVLYFSYSGHGGRLAASGAPMLALLDGALTRDELLEHVIKPLPVAAAHLFIDACHAGGLVTGRDGSDFATQIETRQAPLRAADLRPTLTG